MHVNIIDRRGNHMELRDILELIYFASAPLLVVIACIGLYQIIQTRSIFRTTSQIQASKLACDRIAYFGDNVVPKDSGVMEYARQHSLLNVLSTKVALKGSTAHITYAFPKAQFDSFRPILSDIIQLMNRLDAYVAPFNTGIADETIAFRSDGRAFCKLFERYLPFMTSLADDVDLEKEDSMHEVFALYLRWKKQLNKQETVSQMELLSKQMAEPNPSPKKPLGTE